jgi:phosphoribosylformimino-5-aminoimidazole carboxamide ribotide isomerase
MIAIPAVDLRGGACVQLVGGSYAEERVRLDDPVGVARQWAQTGFSRLHVVDLDAATGRGDNESVIRDILREWDGVVQVGGGVRSTERIEALLRDGASYVVVGTRAIEERGWLEEIAREFPDTIIVAADVRERNIVTRGWATQTTLDIVRFVDDTRDLALAGLLVTAVHKEGLVQGTDLRLFEDVAEAAAVPVIASGGVSSGRDLEDLTDVGVAGAVIGMALYTGALDARSIAEEFCE